MGVSPGPWTVETDEDGYGVVDAAGHCLAWMLSESDARLMAAAPDLLKALRDLRCAWFNLSEDGDAEAAEWWEARADEAAARDDVGFTARHFREQTMEAAKAAVTKATGE